MAGDTWVPLDGRDPTTFFYTCWISDCGPYIGPIPADLVPTSAVTWLPSDADSVMWVLAIPKPGGDDAHVADGTYSTNVFEQIFSHTGSSNVDTPAVDPTVHLFAVWFDSAYPNVPTSAVDPALLATPSASPFDLVPAALVSGGRLVPPPGIDVDIDAAAMTMPPSMPLFTLATVVLLSGGVFNLTIGMPPGSVSDALVSIPPGIDLGPDDPIYAEPGP